jgi:hypothetical protein
LIRLDVARSQPSGSHVADHELDPVWRWRSARQWCEARAEAVLDPVHVVENTRKGLRRGDDLLVSGPVAR